MKLILIAIIITGVSTRVFGQLPQIKPYVYQPTYDARAAAEERELLIRLIEMKKEENAIAEAKAKQKAIAMMQQTKSIYSSLNSFPAKIEDGWHNIIATNNYDFCDSRKVYISNNQIVKYVVDNWAERNITFSSQVTQGKGLVKLNGSESQYLDIYFIDFCLNPNSRATPPMKAGKVSFWTNWKRASSVTLLIEGFEIGKFNSYFDTTPICGQEGTINFEFKPGTYNYKAIGITALGSEVTWEGIVNIRENSCSLQGLTKN